jgi:hypothetical protein
LAKSKKELQSAVLLDGDVINLKERQKVDVDF